MECENCHKEHDGSYGSGRFCSKQCRGAFTAKMPKKHLRNQPYECCYCHEIIYGRNALARHKKAKHPERYCKVWNKGKTKENDLRIAKASSTYKQHLQEGKVHIWCEGKHLSVS